MINFTIFFHDYILLGNYLQGGGTGMAVGLDVVNFSLSVEDNNAFIGAHIGYQGTIKIQGK